jgi:hypothetical protein
MTVPPLLGTSLEGDDFVLAEWVDDGDSSAARPVAALHRHHGDDEVRAGSAVLVPRGVAHTFWNAGDGRARYVIVMTPRIAALVAALHEPGAFDDVHALFRRFDSELLA